MSDSTTNEEYDRGFAVGYKAGRDKGYVKGKTEAIDEVTEYIKKHFRIGVNTIDDVIKEYKNKED